MVSGAWGKRPWLPALLPTTKTGTYKVIQFFGQVEAPMILQRLVEEARIDMGSNQPQLVDQLAKFIESDQPSKAKLQQLIQNYLSREKIILLFDNFETNQEENGEVQERVANQELAEFLNYLFQNLPN